MSYSEISNPATLLFVNLRELGWIGVDLFFVLSGFLISGLLYREVDETGELKVKRFLLRRGFKIWPSYYFAYGGMTLLIASRATFNGDWTKTNKVLSDGFWNSIFIQNYVSCERWPNSWTIAVEEHFYLVLPLFFLLVIYFSVKKQHRLRGIFWICLAVILLTPIFRFVQLQLHVDTNWDWSSSHYPWRSLYMPSHMRADSLCFGVLMGYLFRYHKSFAKKLSAQIWLGIPLIAFSFATPLIWPLFENWFCGTIGFSIIALGFSWLVLAAGMFPDTGKTGSRIYSIPCNALAWIGVYSYTIYLTHSIVFKLPGMDFIRRNLMRILGNHVPDSILVWLDCSFFWFCSILSGVLLSHLIERPLLKVRKRVAPAFISPKEAQ